MPARKPNILISGAGVAGPILAYWLTHDGFNPTVIERGPALRTGGHPVHLWGSAVEVVERMGVLPELEAASTRNDIGVMLAEGQRPVEIDLKRLVVEIADRHIEIMRGRLDRFSMNEPNPTSSTCSGIRSRPSTKARTACG